MPNKKISQLTPKGSALAGTDLLEVSVFNGATYDTKSLTGANVVSGLQPTLFSGTNIKTINSTSLLGSGDIAISTGLTVGTTAITSGTVGRVLFEGTGNVVQQDSTLFWDNTNKRLGVGATPSTSVRLDVRAQGALSTDIAFRVRNSADTVNLATHNGDGSFRYTLNSGTGTFKVLTNGAVIIGANAQLTESNAQSSDIIIGRYSQVTNVNGERIVIGDYAQAGGFYGVSIGKNAINTGNGGINIGWGTTSSGTASIAIGMSMMASASQAIMLGANYGGSADNNIANSFMLHLNGTTGGNYQHFFVNGKTNVVLRTNTQLTAGTQFEAAATNCITTHNGTAPTVGIIDASVMYSSDIVAGNSAPHFRTENGNIIKLYRETTAVAAAAFVANTSLIANDSATYGGYTMGQVVAALKAQGLLA